MSNVNGSKIALNAGISAGARVASIVFGLLSVGLVARTLGQEGFGQYSTVLAYLALFVILADLGLYSLMSREISRSERNLDEIAGNFFSLRVASSALFLLFGFFTSFLFPYPDEVKLAIGLGAVGFLFLSASQLLLGVFQRYLTLHKAALAEVFGRSAQLLLVWLIYIWFKDYRASTDAVGTENALFLFIMAMSAASFVIFLAEFIFARKHLKLSFSINFKKWFAILKVAWPIALSITLTLVYFKIDTIFLSVMKPPADVGIYGAAYRVLESLIFFPSMFAGIMLPILSKEAVRGKEEFNDVLSKSLKAISIFALPVVVGGVMISYSIVNLIGGREFLSAGSTMQILFIAIGLIFFGNILGRAVIALDLQKKAVFAYLFGMVLNVALNLIFIPKYTYIGAAWTTVFTELLIVIFLFWLIKQKTGIAADFKGLCKVTAASLVMAGALYFFVAPISEPLGIIKLFGVMVVGALAYFGVLYAIKGVDIKEISALFNIKTPVG